MRIGEGSYPANLGGEVGTKINTTVKEAIKTVTQRWEKAVWEFCDRNHLGVNWTLLYICL